MSDESANFGSSHQTALCFEATDHDICGSLSQWGNEPLSVFTSVDSLRLDLTGRRSPVSSFSPRPVFSPVCFSILSSPLSSVVERATRKCAMVRSVVQSSQWAIIFSHLSFHFWINNNKQNRNVELVSDTPLPRFSTILDDDNHDALTIAYQLQKAFILTY